MKNKLLNNHFEIFLVATIISFSIGRIVIFLAVLQPNLKVKYNESTTELTAYVVPTKKDGNDETKRFFGQLTTAFPVNLRQNRRQIALGV
jgi:hypothetical protein